MLDEKGRSKTDTIVKLVLVFFISLLSFSVGTFVGKQVSDSDYRRANLEQDYKGAREVASEDADKDGDDKPLTESDINSLSEEFVQSEKENKTTAAKNVDATTDKKAEQMGYKKVSKDDEPAQKIAAGESPTHDEPQTRKPDSVMPMNVANSAVGKFTVQVASFADEAEAKSQASALKEKGWNAFYLTADVKGRKWYRVSVGLFSDAKSAMGFREKFMKEANASSAIVQKIVN
jgi:cell division protein FtsN